MKIKSKNTLPSKCEIQWELKAQTENIYVEGKRNKYRLVYSTIYVANAFHLLGPEIVSESKKKKN